MPGEKEAGETMMMHSNRNGFALLPSLPPAAKMHAVAMLVGLAEQQGVIVTQVGRQKASPVSDKTQQAARKDRQRRSPGE
jgi:hypothetical protein